MSDDNQTVTSAPQPVRKVRADARERAEQVWAMRLGGATWDQCAKTVGLATPQSAMRCVRETYGEVPQIDREELRHLWRERTEVLWRQAMRDVLDRRQGAVIAATKVASLASFLDGLGAPQRVEVGVLHMLADLDALMQEEGL
ncbi:hypothetical protein [Nocardioides stalactiti]|uniref:hypothetical protein n=1 Tax=Nocardioides stalactiti TaxID=2755356 RepID=UPI0016016581|nr:hypothetical protein [Nocardioides stalactiti]